MSSRTSEPTGTHRTFGPYRLLGLLGRGAMGEVYRAYDTEHRREVALKLLPPELAGEPEYRARFSREAELAARLHNPHVIPIHRYGEIDGRLFLDMRLVVGTDLDELLRSGPLPVEAAVDVVAQIADALDAAHADGLLHRDVKPSNVLLTAPRADGSRFAYLCDFGIALPIETSDPRLTRTSTVVGTCAYMAPERFGAERPDRQADVYSLACLLFTALTGQVPFPHENLLVLIAAHGNPTRPRPSAVRAGMPAALDEVVVRGMAVDKRDRYRSAGELAEAATRARSAPATTPTDPTLTDPTLTDPTPPGTAPGPAGRRAPGRGADRHGPNPEGSAPRSPEVEAPPDPLRTDPTGTAPRRAPQPAAAIPDAGTEQRPDPTPGRLRNRLTDPWAWLIAAVSGGATWAVLPDSALAVPLGIGVGAVVFGTAAAGDALVNRRPPTPPR